MLRLRNAVFENFGLRLNALWFVCNKISIDFRMLIKSKLRFVSLFVRFFIPETVPMIRGNNIILWYFYFRKTY